MQSVNHDRLHPARSMPCLTSHADANPKIPVRRGGGVKDQETQLSADPVTEAALTLHEFLMSDLSIGDTLDRIARCALAAVQPAVAVGVSLADERGGFTTAVATDRVAPIIDQAQYDTGLGPCLTAYAENRVVLVDDTSRWTGTWPLFAEVAVEQGVLSTLSLPLAYGGQVLGTHRPTGPPRPWPRT
jgi:hypothetical protein